MKWEDLRGITAAAAGSRAEAPLTPAPATIPGADWTVLVPVLLGLVAILGMALRAFIRLQRRQEERDDAVAAREQKNLQTLEDIARPLRQIPNQLASQGEALRALRDAQEHSFRALSVEIRDAGTAAREATRELIAEIRAAFRIGGPGNHRV